MWDYEDLKYAIDSSTSFRAAARMLRSSHTTVRKAAADAGINVDHLSVEKRKLALIGNTYGKLTIVKVFQKREEGSKLKSLRWYCECQCECTVICVKRLEGVTGGHVKTCGCSSFEQRDYWGENNPAFKGYGDLEGSKVYELAHGAKKRGLEFFVTKEYLWSLYEAQDRKCALTGVPIAFGRRGDGNTSASLDRIDSKQGYIEGNVQWVHRLVNQMKWSVPQDQFVEICYLVTEHNRRPSQVALTVSGLQSAR